MKSDHNMNLYLTNDTHFWFIFSDCSWINDRRIIQATNLSADFFQLCLNLVSKYELVHGQGTYQLSGRTDCLQGTWPQCVDGAYSRSQCTDFFRNIVNVHFRVSPLQIALIMLMLNCVSNQCVQNVYYEYRLQKFSTALWIVMFTTTIILILVWRKFCGAKQGFAKQ